MTFFLLLLKERFFREGVLSNSSSSSLSKSSLSSESSSSSTRLGVLRTLGALGDRSDAAEDIRLVVGVERNEETRLLGVVGERREDMGVLGERIEDVGDNRPLTTDCCPTCTEDMGEGAVAVGAAA